jgi:hypothetical protein
LNVSLSMQSEIASDRVLAALRARSSRIRQVRYRLNRTVLLSVSRDGRTLNTHECFRHAPPRVLDAIATFVTAPRRSTEFRTALDTIRGWDGAERGLEAAKRARRRRSRPAPGRDGEAVAPVRVLFDGFNRVRFGGQLPAIPLRISGRMRRALGTISYEEEEGRRRVREIAISADLLLPANAAVLRDTLLHEMAHAEAWLRHGHQGHGPVWRRIAERVGCVPRALTRVPIRRRPRNLSAAAS